MANEEDGSPLVPDELTEEEAKKTTTGVAAIFAVLFVLAGVLALAVLAYRIYPAQRPRQASPSFVDIIFANNLVVFAARVLLFSAAAVLAVTAFYIVYSMVKSMKAGQPLEQFGPLRVRAVQDLSEELEQWQAWWSESNDENRELRERLERADLIVSDLLEQNQLLRQDLETASDKEDEGQ